MVSYDEARILLKAQMNVIIGNVTLNSIFRRRDGTIKIIY
jgi:hypothetical protein